MSALMLSVSPAVCVALIVAVILCRSSPVVLAVEPGIINATNNRPNFIVIITDDQDSLLGSLDVMPHLRDHLIRKGTDMRRAFVTTPICCPSRSSLLTGLYVHNHHTFTNNANCTSQYWQERHEPLTFGKQLNDAGYKTAYVGKYLNKYDGSYVPPGWDRWVGQVKNSRFYNYSVNEDDVVSKHGSNYNADYFSDLVTNRSLGILQDWTESSPTEPRQPFLLVMSYPAPHGPEDSAPQYQSLFTNNTWHRTASYNVAPNPDKEWLLRRTESMPRLHMQFTDLLQQKRLQTLQSVDDGVRRLLEWLDASDAANDTYVFYTSDHGYHLGQFGLLKGKSTPYEFDIRVPLIVRGPGVPAGGTCDRPVLNIDLAPTLLDLAGVRPARPMDGASYASLVLPPLTAARQNLTRQPWRRSFLVERGKMTPRKMSLRRELETAKNFDDEADQLPRTCDQRDLRSLSCDLGDRFHCVPNPHRLGEHQMARCPTVCRCRRSLVLPISQYVWKHCWWQRQDDSDEEETNDDENQDDVKCEYSSLGDWLRDRRMMRLTQRKLDAIQGQLNQMRMAMRRNKATLMRVKGCGCSGGGLLSARLEERPNDGASIASLLRRKLRRKRRGGRNHSECNLRFMNCFFHDKSHWKTPPLWTGASICFCSNANNYTYWCLRTVEPGNESLYCEFVTGFISYYNMTSDPSQLVNRVAKLSFERRASLHAALGRLRACSGPACQTAS